MYATKKKELEYRRRYRAKNRVKINLQRRNHRFKQKYGSLKNYRSYLNEKERKKAEKMTKNKDWCNTLKQRIIVMNNNYKKNINEVEKNGKRN